MQNEGWKGSRNDIAVALRLNQRTVTDRLRLLESYNIIKIHEGDWQWFFEITSPDEWNPVLKEAFNKKLDARDTSSSKKKTNLDAPDASSSENLDVLDTSSSKIDETILMHPVHQPRCTPYINLDAPGTSHIYTKDSKTKEKNFLS